MIRYYLVICPSGKAKIRFLGPPLFTSLNKSGHSRPPYHPNHAKIGLHWLVLLLDIRNFTLMYSFMINQLACDETMICLSSRYRVVKCWKKMLLKSLVTLCICFMGLMAKVWKGLWRWESVCSAFICKGTYLKSRLVFIRSKWALWLSVLTTVRLVSIILC